MLGCAATTSAGIARSWSATESSHQKTNRPYRPWRQARSGGDRLCSGPLPGMVCSYGRTRGPVDTLRVGLRSRRAASPRWAPVETEVALGCHVDTGHEHRAGGASHRVGVTGLVGEANRPHQP
jgi:hypothetical protein